VQALQGSHDELFGLIPHGYDYANLTGGSYHRSVGIKGGYLAERSE